MNWISLAFLSKSNIWLFKQTFHMLIIMIMNEFLWHDYINFSTFTKSHLYCATIFRIFFWSEMFNPIDNYYFSKKLQIICMFELPRFQKENWNSWKDIYGKIQLIDFARFYFRWSWMKTHIEKIMELLNSYTKLQYST